MKQRRFSTPITWELAHTQKKLIKTSEKTVGVLALQGDFLEHIQTLERIGVSAKEVRLPEDLIPIDALIIPGGESTTIANLLDSYQLREPLKTRIKNGMPVWGTCAGMILLAERLTQDTPVPLGVMHISVNRNAFGRQIDSFEAPLWIKPLGSTPLPATFIRAPLITNVGPAVEILATLPDGTIVAAKQGSMIGTSFHPELTKDTRFHEYFVSLINQ